MVFDEAPSSIETCLKNGYIMVGGVREAATEESNGDQHYHASQMGVTVPINAGVAFGINVPAPATQRWYRDFDTWSGLQVTFVGPLN